MFNKRKTEEPQPVSTALPADQAAPSPPSSEDNDPGNLFIPPSFKETPMARSPFAPPPMPATPASPVVPSAAAPRPLMPNTTTREAPERRTLVVGRGISVQGTVQDAERLVVEGTVEATMINANELSIAPGGVFKGEVEVDDAEVAGTIDGTLVARATLVVRSTGRVLGTARCRRLQVEDGGQITGRIEMLSETNTYSPATASLTDA